MPLLLPDWWGSVPVTGDGECDSARTDNVLPNERARKILFDAHWSATGWKDEPKITEEERVYAQRAGYMFPRATLSHADVVERLIAARERVTVPEVANAFLASLSTRRGDLRSALGSYAAAMHVPQHPFQPSSSPYLCSICNAYDVDEDIDYDAMSFERHKWGGVRHLAPVYAAFDLEQFARTPSAEASQKDTEIFQAMLAAIANLSPADRPTQLVRALTGVLPSNKAEREVLVSILGYAGILPAPDHPSFFQAYVPYEERNMPPVSTTDWDYPLWYWRAEFGVDRQALSYWFPGVNPPDFLRS
jgi:hypothetical protein